MTNYRKIWDVACNLQWCALVTTGRTGTKFFQSLLDGHPEIFVFNGSLYFHTFWQRAVTVRHAEQPNLVDLLDEFIGVYLMALKSRYQPSERKDQLGEERDTSIDINTGDFKAHVIGLLAGQPITSRSFLTAIYVAYELCLERAIDKKKIFFHHMHHVRKVDDYMQDFPESKIICMTRDPRALYVSGVENWRRYQAESDNSSYPLYVLWRAVDEILPLSKYDDGRLKVLKMENLANEETLHAICQWLNIEFNICLKESTWGGLRWWGDVISQNEIPKSEKGFSKTMATSGWEEKLNSVDKALINYLFVNQLEWYGYPFSRQRGLLIAIVMAISILIPTGYERRYLSPRFLIRAVLQKQPITLIRSFYHPLRRIIQFYKWFYRRNFGTYFAVEYFGVDKS